MCSGSGARRKQIEMEIILKLGSMQPQGLNNVFLFHLNWASLFTAVPLRSIFFERSGTAVHRLNWARVLRLPRALRPFKSNMRSRTQMFTNGKRFHTEEGLCPKRLCNLHKLTLLRKSTISIKQKIATLD